MSFRRVSIIKIVIGELERKLIEITPYFPLKKWPRALFIVKIRHERRRLFSSGESVNAFHGPYSYITRNELSPWSIIRQAV